MKTKETQGRREFRLYSLVLTLAVLLAVVVFNVALGALAEAEGWYFYTAPQYAHEANGLPDNYFGDTQDKSVSILFCAEEEALTADSVSNLVWQTAAQFARKYTFINVKTVNIYLDPQEVEPYRPVYDAEGTLQEMKDISKESVIFVCGERHIVLSLSDFFFLDSQRYITAYNGEEAMAQGIRYVLHDVRPVAAFTVGHGETIAPAYASLLAYAGYDVRTVDLATEELHPLTEIVVCMQPLYDFEQAAEGSGLRTEMERIEDFLADGGSLQLFLDPYAGRLEKVDALLASFGLSAGEAVLRADNQSAVSIDGYTFMPDFADNTLATAVKNKTDAATDARLVVKDAGVVTVGTPTKDATVYPLLTANATPYREGEPVGEEDNLCLAARAELSGENGGSVLLVNGIYLTAGDVLESDGRANRDFFYAYLEETEAQRSPLGATTLVFESTLLEDLTLGEANRYARILVLWFPLVLLLCGTVILVRRRRR